MNWHGVQFNNELQVAGEVQGYLGYPNLRLVS